MKKKQNIVTFVAIAVLICALIFLGVTVITRIFSLTDLHAELTGTLLGTIITAIVTVLLLKGQTEIEENKDIGIHIFEKKQDVYFDFIDALEKITQDGKITVPDAQNANEKDELQELIYQLGKVQMTASKETSKRVTEQLGAIIRISQMKNSNVKYSDFAEAIFKLVAELRSDLYSNNLNINQKEEFEPVSADLFKDSLEIAGLDVKQAETDEEILANYCDLMVAEFKATYHTKSTIIKINFKESNSLEAAKEFLSNSKTPYLQISTPLLNGDIFDFELIRSGSNQAGLRKKDWGYYKNINPINFVNKDAAFYNFKSADENERKQIVKETLAACDGLEELLKS